MPCIWSYFEIVIRAHRLPDQSSLLKKIQPNTSIIPMNNNVPIISLSPLLLQLEYQV